MYKVQWEFCSMAFMFSKKSMGKDSKGIMGEGGF